MEVAIILIVIVVLFLAFLIYGQIKWGKKPESEKQSFSEKINEQTQQILEVEKLPILHRRPTPNWPLPRMCKSNAEHILNIVGDSVNQVNRCVMPHDFFEGWNIIFWALNGLSKYQHELKFKGDKPSALLIRYKSQYNASLHEFLERYAKIHWDSKIRPLKTTQGKLNKNKKFLDELLPYWGDMTEDAQIRAEELKAVEEATIKLESEKK